MLSVLSIQTRPCQHAPIQNSPEPMVRTAPSTPTTHAFTFFLSQISLSDINKWKTKNKYRSNDPCSSSSSEPDKGNGLAVGEASVSIRSFDAVFFRLTCGPSLRDGTQGAARLALRRSSTDPSRVRCSGRISRCGRACRLSLWRRRRLWARERRR